MAHSPCAGAHLAAVVHLGAAAVFAAASAATAVAAV